MQFKAFKNCEDNIEFLANDIKSFDGKIKEVKQKLSVLKERKTGYEIDGVPIMKGSTLTFTIIDGEFDDNFFDSNKFEPRIKIIRKSRYQINHMEVREQVEEIEQTKVVKKPDCMTPEWREVLTFDITKPSDEISIQIINDWNNEEEVLGEKPFIL